MPLKMCSWSPDFLATSSRCCRPLTYPVTPAVVKSPHTSIVKAVVMAQRPSLKVIHGQFTAKTSCSSQRCEQSARNSLKVSNSPLDWSHSSMVLSVIPKVHRLARENPEMMQLVEKVLDNILAD